MPQSADRVVFDDEGSWAARRRGDFGLELIVTVRECPAEIALMVFNLAAPEDCHCCPVASAASSNLYPVVM